MAMLFEPPPNPSTVAPVEAAEGKHVVFDVLVIFEDSIYKPEFVLTGTTNMSKLPTHVVVRCKSGHSLEELFHGLQKFVQSYWRNPNDVWKEDGVDVMKNEPNVSVTLITLAALGMTLDHHSRRPASDFFKDGHTIVATVSVQEQIRNRKSKGKGSVGEEFEGGCGCVVM